jgi:ribonuclease H / adenosylcobalamin/alpha-ribazole phosphatase
MCDGTGHVLAGRAAGVSLNAEGRSQAARLAERLRDEPLRAIYSSPLERALDTARAIGKPHRLTPCVDAALNEIDFGEWTGCALDELDSLGAWRDWNERRHAACIPGGERMRDVQARAVGTIEELRERHPKATAVIVSHGDVIKAAVAHYLGMSLDNIGRFDIDPASITTLEMEPWGVRMVRINS